MTGYTYDQIADMTMQQQYSLLSAGKNGDTANFRTMREYEQWVQRHG